MLKRIETLKAFYSSMQESKAIRAALAAQVLAGSPPEAAGIGKLRSLLAALNDIPKDNGCSMLRAGEKMLALKLDYEIGELEKDLLFLEKGEQALLACFERLHPGFSEQLRAGRDFFGTQGRGRRFRNFISDRDGTVNNYCGRYLSSIQSVYNAVFLSHLALGAAVNSVILTSAPLADGGLLDISVAADGLFVYAGSKGREYRDRTGRIGRFPIDGPKQAKLDELNRRLGELLQEPDYEPFALIGSGLQHKFGQTTVARQDIYGSIPEAESRDFMQTVSGLIREIDPEGLYFKIEDTGKDIEIILTVEGEGGLKDFDKGDGVSFLDHELDLGLNQGPNLICGDTSSDLPMVRAAAVAPETWTVFVTRDEGLRRSVRSLCPHSLFVSEPDILVALLDDLGKEGR